MNRHLILSISLLLTATLAAAQQLRIGVELPGQEGKEITLAYYYLDKIYAADTATLDQNGKGVFEKDSLLTQGLYKILIDKDHHFDFLLGSDQEFSLYNATSDAKKMKIEGSAESEAFVDYIVYLEGIKQKGDQLGEELGTADENRKKELQIEINGLTNEMKAYWEKIRNELPNSFLYRFLVANEVPQLDISTLSPEVQENDSLLLQARFLYQKEHFWDNFDYTDERFLFTPLYKPKLETWFKNVLYPAYDSVKPYVYEFLRQVENNPRIFQFATSFFLNSSLQSNILGMDALFVDLANDFYSSGKAFWANQETINKIQENVLFLQSNLLGKTAPELQMENIDGEFVSLHQIDAKITVVLIYEPNCGHCKAFVPPFYNDVYLPYKNKGLEVFAIYSMDKKDEWEAFVNEHGLHEWINVWDPHNVSRFKILYDARITPGIYILDENKTIIAKKLDLEQMKQLVSVKLD